MSSSSTIYRSFTQEELDQAYDQRSLVPDLSGYIKQWETGADDAARNFEILPQIAYGPSAEEYVDIINPGSNVQANGDVLHIHFHGGAWRMLGSRHCWHIAAPWVACGETFVPVNFGLVPEISLAEQVAQARAAVKWCDENARNFGLQDYSITVSGHSSGAHLAALVGLCQWQGGDKFQAKINRVILASGTYDFEPVQLSARNDYLKLSKEEALSLSPICHLHAQPPPTEIIYSQNELSEFQRHATDLARALESRGTVTLSKTNDPTHFDTWKRVAPNR